MDNEQELIAKVSTLTERIDNVLKLVESHQYDIEGLKKFKYMTYGALSVVTFVLSGVGIKAFFM